MLEPPPPASPVPTLSWPGTRAHWGVCDSLPLCPSTGLALLGLLSVLRLPLSLGFLFLPSPAPSFLVSISSEPRPCSSPATQFADGKVEVRGQATQPLKNLTPTPSPLVDSFWQGMKFDLRGKLRPVVGAGVRLSWEEHSFCGPSSILRAPPLRAWAGEGAWVPTALKGLNVLAFSSLPNPGPSLVLPCWPTLPEPHLDASLPSITTVSPLIPTHPILSPPYPEVSSGFHPGGLGLPPPSP